MRRETPIRPWVLITKEEMNLTSDWVLLESEAVELDGGINTAGTTRCLDAFIVALYQAYEGEEKGWYTSTLQLQLASVELCRVCSRAPTTLHARVHFETPRRMWSSIESREMGASHLYVSTTPSRVPVVCALHLTWELPVRCLVELWRWPVALTLIEDMSAADVTSVVWDKRLKHLVVDARVDVDTGSVPRGQLLRYVRNNRVVAVAWPDSLEQLSFGMNLNQPIIGMVWPASLRKLSLGYRFNQPIVDVMWPASLQRISFGCCFNKPIVGVEWPASLQRLSFGQMFARSVAGVVWPTCLRELSFEYCFNQPIARVEWPASLQKLSFGAYFNQPVARVGWPASLRQLEFGDSFNNPIVGGSWPTFLQRLSFGRDFNRPVAGVKWPASLQRLSFGREFNQLITGVEWPASLEKLSFGANFNQPVDAVLWPASLQKLSFGAHFNQPLDGIVWPASMQALHIPEKVDQQWWKTLVVWRGKMLGHS